MKVNNLHQNLKDLYKGRSTQLILGFEFEHKEEVERCMNLFNAGYWSVAPFAFEPDELFAIQLKPQYFLEESSVVQGDESGFTTFAPNLSSFLPFLQLAMLENPKFVKYIIEDWNSLLELSLPYREYSKNLGVLDYLQTYLHDRIKLDDIKKTGKYYTEVYLDFWAHYNNTPQQKNYASLIQALVDNSLYLPDFEKKDYGVWTTRVYNALAQRAYQNMGVDTVVKFEQYNFHSFMQPHGFDAADLSFAILPSSSRSSYTLNGILDFFDTDPDLSWDYSSNIQNHPLFSVGETVRKDKYSYNGDAHIKAAKIIDEQLGDPVMAWNALVSAGYWSGVNFNEPNLTAWKAAIDLSEKHGWKEINQVLNDQLEFYNYYNNKM